MTSLAVRIAAVAVLALSLLAAPAMAQPAIPKDAAKCDSPVVDLTKKHVLQDHPEVQSGVDKLKTINVDVRIRALQKAPEVGLDAVVSSLRSNCTGWREPNGDLRKNLLVFVFSADGQDTIYYGGNLASAMDKNADHIRLDFMDPKFREHEFASGIASAQAETYSVIKKQKHDDHTALIIAIIVIVILVLVFGVIIIDWDFGSSSGGGSSGGFWDDLFN